MANLALQRVRVCAALLLASCATPQPGARGATTMRFPPVVLEAECLPLTLLAGEYRRAVLAHDVAGVSAFVVDEALQCDPDAYLPADAVRQSLADPRSFLTASLFDGTLLRSGRYAAAGAFGRESQAELLASEGLVVDVTNQAETSRMARRARIAYKVPKLARLEVGFECRSGRWILQDWGGLECYFADQPQAPAPASAPRNRGSTP